MIEVIPCGNGFRWQMISAAGRVLAYAVVTFPCIVSAAEDAKRGRARCWAGAAAIDHRMGACL